MSLVLLGRKSHVMGMKPPGRIREETPAVRSPEDLGSEATLSPPLFGSGAHGPFSVGHSELGSCFLHPKGLRMAHRAGTLQHPQESAVGWGREDLGAMVSFLRQSSVSHRWERWNVHAMEPGRVVQLMTVRRRFR